MKNLFVMAAMLLSLLAPINKAKASLFPYSGAWYLLTAVPIMGGLAIMGGDDDGDCRVILCLDKAAGLAIMIGGIILLDEENASLDVTKIDQDLAKNLKLSPSEKASFNNSVDEVNILKDEILSIMLETEDHSVETANALWEDTREFIDQDTYSALQKLRKHIGKQLLEQRK